MPLTHDQTKIFAALSQKSKEALNSAEILITGGSGFFGKNLLEFFNWYLINHNSTLKVTILSRDPHKSLNSYPHFTKQKNFKFIKNDITNLDFPNQNYSHIIHGATAASAALNAENPLQMADTILQGTKNILEYAKKNNVQNFLFISSGAVYGKQPAHITHVTEGYSGAPDCLNPAYAYHEAKRMAEMYTGIYSKIHGIETKIARCFAFTGPYQEFNIHFAIGNFIYDALYKNEIFIKGDGTPLRSYLYSSDLVLWLLEILFCGKKNEAYNVGSDVSVSIVKLANIVADEVSKLTGKRANIIVNQTAKQNISIEQYVPDIKKIKEDLNLNISVSLTEAVFKTAQWLNSKV